MEVTFGKPTKWKTLSTVWPGTLMPRNFRDVLIGSAKNTAAPAGPTPVAINARRLGARAGWNTFCRS